MMKIRKRVAGAALLTFAVLLASSGKSWAAGETWEQRVEITAHRGNSSQAPDNTLEVGPATGKQGKIWELTFEELRQINPKPSMGPSFRDARVPSLSEAMDLCKDKIKMNLEIKVNGHQTADFVARVVAMVREKGMDDQCMITSFQYSVLEQVKALAPGLKTGLITNTAIDPAQPLPAADYVMLNVSLTIPQVVSGLQAQGKKVGVWTVNDGTALEKCRLAGADNVITDKPGTIL